MPLCPVALLELLARPAPARVVAVDLLDGGHAALLDDGRGLVVDVAARLARRGIGVGAGLRGAHAARVGDAARARLRPRRRVLLLGGRAVLALDLHLDVEDHAREVRPDRVHEVGEQRERLVLVGDDRLDLGEPAQVDALAQVVHVVEVLAPAAIDDLQQQVALERAHQLRAELALALVVEPASALAQLALELLAVEALEVDVAEVELVGEDLVQRDHHAVDVPVLDEVAGRVVVDDAPDDRRDLVARVAAHVLALEDLVAIGVDDAALLVHDVVVLEHALADEEVLLLDLALGLLDLLGEHPGLDGLLVALLVVGAELVEDAVDPVAGEQADEVVLGAEEEARLARVALAAGAAAQLVVDAP